MIGVRSSLAVLLASVCVATAPVGAQHGSRRTDAYDPAVVHAFRTLPVQDEGRIKPFDTFAQFVMLRLNQHRGKTLPDDPAKFGQLAGEILGPTEWAMDVLLYPEQADDYPVFVVTDAQALHAMGIGEIVRKKRDRYSYNELAPGLSKLESLWREYSRIDESKRELLQQQIVDLAHNILTYQDLRRGFEPARAHLHIGESRILREVYGGVDSVGISAALRGAREVMAAYRTLASAGVESLSDADRAEVDAVSKFLGSLSAAADASTSLVWLPPADQRQEAWLDLHGVLDEIIEDGPAQHESQLVALQLLERVVGATQHGAGTAGDALLPWIEHVRNMAFARGEARKVDLEVAYYEWGLLDKGFYGFLLALVSAVVVWLRPRWRLPYVATWGLTSLATASLVGGIVFRCVLLGRPPVLNLYDTILFITATASIVGIVIEAINRGRIAITMSAVLGAVGLFIAGRFEVLKGEDTLHQLQAVLDTNFWLATHVTTVTFGYAAGLLAGALAHVYLLGKLFGFRRDDPGFYRQIGQMVYGVLCFGILLSTVGTILGGIWANYSWGRFWGWDPKENGALMIVLWELGILHARLGGLIRNWGMCLAAVLGNIVVAFSWWGVNLLGEGLHSYGFTSGISTALNIFYGSQLLVFALGCIAWWVSHQVAKQAQNAQSGANAVQQTT